MAKGDLKINGQDAYTAWGISLDEKGLSMLMTPAPNKDIISNKSRLEHGKRIINNNPKMDERNLSISINISAPSKDEFLQRYAAFCEVLATGSLEIETRYQPNVVYRMIYLSCSQFSEYTLGLGKFTLRLNEPDPSNRAKE